MKKIFSIKTKDDSYFGGTFEYNIFAKDISEAVSKIVPLLNKKKNTRIVEAEFLCELEEDKDLKRYLKGEGMLDL